MTEFKPIKEGKVREIYDNGDSLIMVATDRISAFDVILKNKVTNKGKVLTQMSKFWFDYTRGLLGAVLSIESGAGRLHQVPGVVPSPREFLPGDRFAPRSSHPQIGRDTRPEMAEVDHTGHFYARHLELVAEEGR